MSTQNQKDRRLEEQFQAIEATLPKTRNPISFEELERVVHKWLLISDPGLIKVVVGTVLANRLKADPVWLFIVAASGGTKTELIRALKLIDGAYPLSDLTPQTFLSGDRGRKDASLLHRIPKENAVFTYKDFTTVLTMHRDKSHAILSQLREIYDGYVSKEFGTGETKSWEGKVGFIAGVTTVIDRYQAVFQVLGERFVQYRPKRPDVIAVAKKAMANSGGEAVMREEIQNAFADYVAGLDIPDPVPPLSEAMEDRLAHLAAFCVQARSGVIREGYSNREIDLIPDTEIPTRLAKQLTTLLQAFRLIGDATEEEDYALIYKIGMDTLPQKRKLVLDVLMAASDYLETAEVATKIDYPTNSTRRILEDLSGLRLVERRHHGAGHADEWQLDSLAHDWLDKAAPDHTEILENINQIFFDGKGIPEMSEG